MDSHQWQKHGTQAKLTLKTKTETGLFEKGLHAVYDYMNPQKNSAVAPIVNLDLKSSDMSHLLVAFLSNVIQWSHLHKAHYHTLIIHEISHNHIIGVLEGHMIEKFDTEFSSVLEKEAALEFKDGWFQGHITFSI